MYKFYIKNKRGLLPFHEGELAVKIDSLVPVNNWSRFGITLLSPGQKVRQLCHFEDEITRNKSFESLMKYGTALPSDRWPDGDFNLVSLHVSQAGLRGTRLELLTHHIQIATKDFRGDTGKAYYWELPVFKGAPENFLHRNTKYVPCPIKCSIGLPFPASLRGKVSPYYYYCWLLGATPLPRHLQKVE